MRAISLAVVFALSAPAALAQPYDPVTGAANAAMEASMAMAEDARRRAAEAQRDAEVARQRAETEQRLQSYQASQDARRDAAERMNMQAPPPPASSARIKPRANALQAGKPGAKPGT